MNKKPDELREAVLVDMRGGMRPCDICKKYSGLSASTPRYWASKYGIPIQPYAPPNAFPPIIKNRIIDMAEDLREKGVTYDRVTEIVCEKITRIAVCTIKRWLHPPEDATINHNNELITGWKRDASLYHFIRELKYEGRIRYITDFVCPVHASDA